MCSWSTWYEPCSVLRVLDDVRLNFLSELRVVENCCISRRERICISNGHRIGIRQYLRDWHRRSATVFDSTNEQFAGKRSCPLWMWIDVVLVEASLLLTQHMRSLRGRTLSWHAIVQPGFDSSVVRASSATMSAIARRSVLTRRSCCCRLFAMMARRPMFALASGLSGAHNAEERQCNGQYPFHISSLTKSVRIVTEVYT
jgi:hypothetical protein